MEPRASRVRDGEKTGGRLILLVEDDGPGLSAAERARVGERGERLDESVPGSGLGLAIVRDISKLYGGFFALDQSPWAGSWRAWSSRQFCRRTDGKEVVLAAGRRREYYDRAERARTVVGCLTQRFKPFLNAG